MGIIISTNSKSGSLGKAAVLLTLFLKLLSSDLSLTAFIELTQPAVKCSIHIVSLYKTSANRMNSCSYKGIEMKPINHF